MVDVTLKLGKDYLGILPVSANKNSVSKAPSVTKTHQKQHNVRQAVLSAAVSVVLGSMAMGNAQAAGLGRLTVQSALGQPLRAELEVTAASREELASLGAKLAPAEAFRQAGLELNPVLSNLRFAIDKRGDRTVIKITSNVPVNEPFVDLMVELNWATGRFVREYTFLLDPPELRVAQQDAGRAPEPSVISPQANAPVAPTRPVPAAPLAQAPAPAPLAGKQVLESPEVAIGQGRVKGAKPITKPVAANKPAAAPVAEGGTSGSYSVKKGDTLAAIARSNAPQGASLEQAIVAIYRSNPSAFFGSVNRMRAGAVLNMPDQAAIAAVDPAEAKQQVRVRSGNFAQAKSRLAARPKRLAVARATQSASGKVAGAVDEGSATKAARDQLKLSKSDTQSAGGAGGAGTVNSKAAGAEQQVANQAALREANSRVVDLERNVANLQKLLELKDKDLAEATKKLETNKLSSKTPEIAAAAKVVGGTALPAAPAKAEPPKADLPKFDAPKVEMPKVEAPKLEVAKTELPKADAPIPSGVIPPATPVASAPAAAALPTPAATVPAVDGSAPVKAVIPPAGPKKITVLPPPQAEPSFVDSLTDNLPLVGGAAGALALLGGGAFWFLRRKKRKESEGFEDSLVAAEAISPNSLFGTTGGQQVDTNNSLFQQNTEQVASGGTVVASTEVDPIAEAEVYIAYGRESQAEDILKEALKRQPDRQQIRLKLAEIYAARKDAPALAAIAKDMHDTTGGQSEDWPRMVTLGMSIDPNNPLYSGKSAGVSSASRPSEPVSSGPHPPRDHGGGTIANAMGLAGGLAAAGAAGVAAAVSSVSSAPAAAVAPVAKQLEPAAANIMDTLDFNLDIDSRIGQMQAPAAPVAAAASKTTVAASSPKIDLDFSLPELSSTAEASTGLADLASDNDFRLDLPALEGLSIMGKEHGGSATGNASLLDSASSLVDLSSINLDLPGHSAVDAPEAESALSANTQQRGRWQEMATKLDLASAYEEIGDKEGARELLDEVIKGGDASQQQRARGMLAKLA